MHYNTNHKNEGIVGFIFEKNRYLCLNFKLNATKDSA